MTQKKILFVATVVKTHIMQFHIPYLKMLKQLGWETAVAAKNDYKNPEDCRIPYCDRYVPVCFGRSPLAPGNFRAFFALRRLIQKENYDVIHCHTPVAAFLARMAAIGTEKRGTKVVYTAHGFHFYKGAPLLNWLLFFPAEWISAFFTDVLITINQEDYRFARKHLHAKRIEYVRGVGVDTERFRKSVTSREQMREALGLGEEDFVLLSVAEMTKNKNHAMMLQALAQIPDRHVKLLCVGRGKLLEQNRAQCRALGLEDRVQFLGYRQDVPDLYRAADGFLFVSFREGLSLSLMEAMSCGLPAIVSPIRGNVDLISNGVEGLHTHLDSKAIARSIEKLASSAELRKELGNAARKKMQAYSLDTIAEQMEKIYLSL